MGNIFAVTVAVGALLSVNTFEFYPALNLFLFLVVFALVSTLDQKGSAVTGVMSCRFTGLLSHKVVFVPFQGRSRASPGRALKEGCRRKPHH